MGSTRSVRFKEGREIPPGRFGLGFSRPQRLRSETERSPASVHLGVVPSPTFAAGGAKAPSLMSDYEGGGGTSLRTAISSFFGRRGREPGPQTHIAQMSSPRQGLHV